MIEHRIGPKTSRLVMRAIEVSDAKAFYQLNSHPDVMRYTGEPMMESEAQARQAIEEYPDFRRFGFGRWACVLKGENTLIGFCGLKKLLDLDEVDVGYRFLPEFWGQGLATEACQASIEFGFRQLELARIIGLVLPDNKASIRVLEKSGLSFEKEIAIDEDQVLLYSIERKVFIERKEFSQRKING